MAIAGRVAVIPKGNYSPSATYQKLDMVYYNGSSYVAKKTSAGVSPTNAEYWMLSMANMFEDDATGTNYKMGIENGLIYVREV